MSLNANYKLLKKIKDDRFDEEKLHQYRLLIQIGVRDFQVAVVAESDQRLLFFEDYILNDLNSYDEQLTVLRGLFEAHAVLQAGFWKEVKISIKNNKFIQLPTTLFLSNSTAEYLKFNATIDPAAELVLNCENLSLNITTVYAAQKELVNWFQVIYQNTKLTFHHQSSALIQGVSANIHKTGNPLYIYVDRFKLHILAFQGGHLTFYNQFTIKQFSDYVKYIMLVMKNLNMDQQTSEVVLWGYIGKNSPHYIEFVKYVRNVSFGERPRHLTFGYLFDELQEHHFFDLYSIDLLTA
ncbi:MAG: DUF3822 family protein [Cyclobacteriaceae bacterium]|nr:DUF3822 family protein [Cyclobacteriaceae bacterium]